ncbi:MAG: hypothetical protein GY892_17735 [Shimia sp.]|nr:hypothetical protein [Shimia sp.]
MLISTQKHFVFAANTKTASTSLEHVLLPYSDIVYDGNPEVKHMRLSAAQLKHPDLFESGDYFVFGVMRDPLEWIASWFRYRSGNKVQSPLPADMSFREFWQRKDWNILHPSGSGKYLQSNIFCDANGAVIADVILPYSGLEAQFSDICDLLEIPYDLPRKNVSRKTGGKSIIPEDLRPEIRAFYEDDYALLNRLDSLNAEGMNRLRRLREKV